VALSRATSYHDIAPARDLGISCVWVNRYAGWSVEDVAIPTFVCPGPGGPDLRTLVTDVGLRLTTPTPAPPNGPAAPARDAVVLLLVVLAVGYPLLFLDRGWIPHDEGMLGQTAVRVLTGELPHRDFMDAYSGGLSYWNALAFVLFDIHLMAPRYLLYGCFLGFLLSTFAVARRFVPDRIAAAAVLCISVWSLPNYPSAMPTWYNLFLALAAIWCFFRYVETGIRAWIIGAGFACGLSLAVKIVGLYTVAGMLMALALQEAAAGSSSDEVPRGRGLAYRSVVVGGMVLYSLLVLLMVRSQLTPTELVHFVLPSVTVAGLVGWRVWTVRSADSSRLRATRFAGVTGLFLGGVAVPLLLLALPFLLTGSVGDLLEGTLVLPFRRLAFAAAGPLRLSLGLRALPVAVLVVVAAVSSGVRRTAALWVLVALLASVISLAGRDVFYMWSWAALLLTPVAAVLAGSWAVARQWNRGLDDPRITMGAAVVTVLATFALVQYPVFGPVYFFYVAPLVILASVVAVSLGGRSWRAPGLILLTFGIAFAGRWIGPASLTATFEGRYQVRDDRERLDLERGRLRVSAEEKSVYESLAATLVARAPNGVMYATPDAPEAYFLSGLRNPTPVLFDFFDEPLGRTERILRVLYEEDVRVVVLNQSPHFSGPPPPELIRALEANYPNGTLIGRFIVRWK